MDTAIASKGAVHGCATIVKIFEFMPNMRLAILHASRAAVDPVANFYQSQQPTWQINHLLDDGIMRSLNARLWPEATARILHHLHDLHHTYQSTAALITCSALPVTSLHHLQNLSPIPVEKIDVPMARLALEHGPRIGILSTFPATQQTTRDLLLHTAGLQPIELTEVCAPNALEALLAGDTARHDQLFFEALNAFDGKIDTLVLAQVSMARLAAPAVARLNVPVLESLSTSLAHFTKNL